MVRMIAELQEMWQRDPPSHVIACDLESALASRILWGVSANVLYDAQEMPVEQLEDCSDGMRAVFASLERSVVHGSDLLVTVSKGAVRYYLEAYGVAAHCVPNFLPKFSAVASPSGRISGLGQDEIIRFVFFGRWAVSRGIEQMIAEWPADPLRRELHIFAAGLPNKLKARKRDLQRSGIFIREPIDISELPETLKSFDVGVVPYDYPYPYNHASPNKFGQYVDSGLYVLCAGLPFVANIVSSYGIGQSFSWRDPAGFSNAVEATTCTLLEDRGSAQRNLALARDSLNWDSFADPVLERFLSLTKLPIEAYPNLGTRFVPAGVKVSGFVLEPNKGSRSAQIWSWLESPRFSSSFVKTVPPVFIPLGRFGVWLLKTLVVRLRRRNILEKSWFIE